MVNKTAASATQLSKFILLHTYLRTTASSQLRENNQIFNSDLTVVITVFLVIN